MNIEHGEPLNSRIVEGIAGRLEEFIANNSFITQGGQIALIVEDVFGERGRDGSVFAYRADEPQAQFSLAKLALALHVIEQPDVYEARLRVGRGGREGLPTLLRELLAHSSNEAWSLLLEDESVTAFEQWLEDKGLTATRLEHTCNEAGRLKLFTGKSTAREVADVLRQLLAVSETPLGRAAFEALGESRHYSGTRRLLSPVSPWKAFSKNGLWDGYRHASPTDPERFVARHEAVLLLRDDKVARQGLSVVMMTQATQQDNSPVGTWTAERALAEVAYSILSELGAEQKRGWRARHSLGRLALGIRRFS